MFAVMWIPVMFAVMTVLKVFNLQMEGWGNLRARHFQPTNFYKVLIVWTYGLAGDLASLLGNGVVCFLITLSGC